LKASAPEIVLHFVAKLTIPTPTTMPTHKRKRSLQDSPVDLSKMRMAIKQLEELKTELEGIEETEAEMQEVMLHVAALEDILNTAKKPVCILLPFDHHGSY
jgi:hypothetical protein